MYNRLLPGPLVLFACAEPPPPAAPESQTLVFEMRTVESTVDGCIAGAPACAYVRLDHPSLVEFPDELADGAEAIVDAIERFLSKPLRESEETGPPARLIDRFMTAFRSREDPSAAPWFVERKVFVLHNTPQVVALSFSERFFLGGDRGFEAFHYANFDPRTGQKLTLSNILTEGKLEELRLVAEVRFRKARGLGANDSLEDAGFHFEERRFTLTENFTVDEKGLTFYYNPDEVAAHSLGPTEIRLSFDELHGLVASPLVGRD